MARYISSGRCWVVAIAVLLFFAATWWLWPKRTVDVVSVDRQHRWAESSAPRQRHVVWQSVDEVAVPIRDDLGVESLGRPLLTDGGLSLYFTRRNQDGTTDIYRSQFDGRHWCNAVPMRALNSAFDDFGPVLSHDGSHLYLYSNRPGGMGGFDLYCSAREGDGWSNPVNLGARINSAFHEFDPAVSPDNRTIFFSSNRKVASTESVSKTETDSWNASLRWGHGAAQFDLFAAVRDAEDQWQHATPLHHVNSDRFNDGSPFVSASGFYLYFASDRPVRTGEPTNYDLFRARIDGKRIRDVENLGNVINSAANEIEPSLSPEGFRIFFSSDRATLGLDGDRRHDHYAIYSSLAGETYHETRWDTSRWRAFIGWLKNHRWWVLFSLLVGAFLAALIWYLREISMRRLPVPGFLMLALMVHLVLVAGSFFIYFGDAVVKHVKEQFDEIKIAPNLANSDRREQPSYETVADLQSVTTERVQSVPRQQSEPHSVAMPAESAVPSLPLKVSSGLQAAKLPEQYRTEEPRTKSQFLKRRRSPAEFETTVADIAPRQLESARVASSRAGVEPEAVTLDARLDQSDAVRAPLPERQLPTNSRILPTASEVSADRYSNNQQVPAGGATSLPRVAARLPASSNETIAMEVVDFVEAGEISVRQANAVTEMSRRETTLAERLPRDVAIHTKVDTNRSPILRLAADGALPISQDLESATPPPATEIGSPSRLERTVAASPNAEQAVVEMPNLIVQPTNGGDVIGATIPPSAERGNTMDRRDFGARPVDALEATPQLASAQARHLDSVQSESWRDTSEPSRLPSRDAVVPAMHRARPNRISVVEQAIPLVVATAGAGDRNSDPHSDRSFSESIEVDRLEIGELHEGVPKQPRLPTRNSVGIRGASVGVVVADRAIFAPPAGGGAAAIGRQRTRVPSLMYAEDNIGLQAMLRLRGVNDAMKRDMVSAFGGSDKTLDAIRLGLKWLAERQHPDGHWSLQEFHGLPNARNASGQGSARSDTAATGLGLLPFLGDGNTHLTGPYQQTVMKGLEWLVTNQKDDGDLFLGGSHTARMYSHGIGTMALCEAYGMSKDPRWREPAQNAVNFIVAAQHSAGGWRYSPREPGDTSVMGWQIMALKSAQMAGLEVPNGTLDKARNWLVRVGGTGSKTGRFGYQNSNASVAMTAEAMLCLEYLGAESTDPRLRGAAAYLLSSLPMNGKESSYYWYYGTQAMYHLQGEFWKQWNDALHPIVMSTQHRHGSLAGTWDPRDQWERQGGRIYATTLRLLMLEIYYRHLPLYQALEQ